MNEKTQAILLKIVIGLKRLKWTAGQDWEITLKGEGHVPLVRHIEVEGNMDNEKWKDNVETMIHLKLSSDDEITYFPEYTVYANIFIRGAENKDVVFKMDVDVAFTKEDVKADDKFALASRKINGLVEDSIENEYRDYIDANAKNIKAYRQGGWQADNDAPRQG
jgi:hypothetical protein